MKASRSFTASAACACTTIPIRQYHHTVPPYPIRQYHHTLVQYCQRCLRLYPHTYSSVPPYLSVSTTIQYRHTLSASTTIPIRQYHHTVPPYPIRQYYHTLSVSTTIPYPSVPLIP
eukprot:3241001-Rhodomonas_salina.1